ncbi:MAG: hypothetical protein PF692_02555 [Kiritimatiellae bacterium]|nr:hypothetical protein [Kiritimatiellia bacterium]
MNESVLIIIILIATVIPFLISYCLIRFLPKARYLPALLLVIGGLYFLLDALSTKPTGGGISGFGDMNIIGGVIAGIICILASGVAFLLSWLMYKWRRSKHVK